MEEEISTKFVAESLIDIFLENGVSIDENLAENFILTYQGKKLDFASARERKVIKSILECLDEIGYYLNMETVYAISEHIRNFKILGVKRIVKHSVRQNRSGEDIVVSLTKFPRYEVYGIIDGHGASKTPHPKRFSEYLYTQIYEMFERVGNNDLSRVIIEESLKNLDDRIKLEWRKNPDEYVGGASVSLAIYDKKLYKLYVSNVGDSPLVVIKGKNVIYTFKPHDTKDPKEAEMIKSNGGVIIGKKVSLPKSRDLIAMTRSMGDYDLKPPLSSTPVVSEMNVTKGMGVVIASDGVFEDLNLKEIESRARHIYEDFPKIPVPKLVEKYSRETDDDCSLIVVKFL